MMANTFNNQDTDGRHLDVKSKLSRGPRTVTIKRDSHGFGFTLRHFIVYPPSSFNKGAAPGQSQGEYTREGKWMLYAVDAMDTIFVREVKKGYSADRAGLVTGDRIIAINSHPLSGKSYSEVVQLIRNSGDTLHLLVVPKDDDILQLYFSNSAYQPVDRGQVKTNYKQSASCCVPNPAFLCSNSRLGESHTTATGYSVHDLQGRDSKCPSCSSHFPNISNRHGTSNYCTYPLQFACAKATQQRLLSDGSFPHRSLQNTAHCDIYLDDKPECGGVTRSPSLQSSFPPPTSRPYRFQDTFSRLLLDMWYPQKLQPSVAATKPHRDHVTASAKNEAMSESDERRDHRSGFANLLTKTVRAFITSPGEKSDGDSSGTKRDSDGSNHSCSYSRSKYHKVKTANGGTNAMQLTPGKVPVEDGGKDEMLETDHISSLHLVAQRLHQFESGTFIEKAQERTNFYKHEFARVSKQSPCRIVSKRAAQFENRSPSFDYPDSPCSDSAVLIQKSNSYRRSDDEDYFGSLSENHLTYGSGSGHLAQQTSQNEYLQHNKLDQGVTYRAKPVTDHHITRRISYLKATAQERILVDSDFSEDDEARSSKRSSTDVEESEHRISKLKAFFGERTPKIRQAIEPRNFPDDHWRLMQGWLSCKILFVDGKRSSDRSWKPVWAFLKGNLLHLFRAKKEPSELHAVTEAEDDFTVNLKMTLASIAHDYTKRKHVLRLRLAGGTEYLFQAESQSNMLEWLRALHSVGLENEKELLWHHTSVLEKAAAYEQQLNLQNKGRLSPVPSAKQGMKLPFRHRSPTGQSPSVKTRRASQGDELGVGPRFGSVLRSRVVPSWRKAQSLQAEILPKGSSIGVHLEDCPLSSKNPYLPLLVEVCTRIVESRGLELVGVYRIPGNNAAVSMLMEAVNQGFDSVNLEDSRWKDVNVVSSLLKAFFRKLREPLLTSLLYQKFMNVSKLENSEKRLPTLKKLIHQLPPCHFETLKFLMKHLSKIVEHSSVNKMEARNLAIVFGPTLARPADSSMVALVTDMSHQCYIVETMITYFEWLFDEDEEKPIPRDPSARRMSHPLPIARSDLLLSNIQKLDASHFGKSQEAFSKEFMTSVMFAPNRRALNRARKVVKDDGPSEEAQREARQQSNGGDAAQSEEAASVSSYDSCWSVAPSLCGKQTYNQMDSMAQERIRRFESETKALLRRDGQQPRHLGTRQAGRMQWGQIEREWEKAKRELEQDDLLDYVADDPSFLDYLLNRKSRDEFSDVHLERINSSLSNNLTLGKAETSSPACFETSSSNCHPRRFSCATDDLDSYESRLLGQHQPLRTMGIHRTENLHITATVSPTRHTITTSSSSPYITATSLTPSPVSLRPSDCPTIQSKSNQVATMQSE